MAAIGAASAFSATTSLHAETESPNKSMRKCVISRERTKCFVPAGGRINTTRSGQRRARTAAAASCRTARGRAGAAARAWSPPTVSEATERSQVQGNAADGAAGDEVRAAAVGSGDRLRVLGTPRRRRGMEAGSNCARPPFAGYSPVSSSASFRWARPTQPDPAGGRTRRIERSHLMVLGNDGS
jgi:hypothetical protein